MKAWIDLDLSWLLERVVERTGEKLVLQAEHGDELVEVTLRKIPQVIHTMPPEDGTAPDPAEAAALIFSMTLAMAQSGRRGS